MMNHFVVKFGQDFSERKEMITAVEADEFTDLDWLTDMLKDDVNLPGTKIWPPGKNG